MCFPKIANIVILETRNNIINEINVKRFLFKIGRIITKTGCFFFLKKLFKFLSIRNYMQLLPIIQEL